MAWSFWSPTTMVADGIVCAHLLAALAIGIVLGYERSYQGHSAGVRTYALVCMATTGLVVLCGLPQAWYGGRGPVTVAADPTRVIQGIMTGIGFLGAGVIMKDGMSVRGLSSAASIWLVAAIGVMIGVGFYAAALAMAALCLLVMTVFKRFERALPHHSQIRLVLISDRHHVMTAEALRLFIGRYGYQIVTLACQADSKGGEFEYDLVLESSQGNAFNGLIDGLGGTDTIREFRIVPVQD